MARMTLSVATEDPRVDPGVSSSLEPISSNKISPEARRCFSQGLERLNRGEALEAAVWFERALEICPDFVDGHVGLGIAYAVDSQIYPALDHLQKATELEPRNFYAHLKLGQLYFKLRIPQKGYEVMARALGCAASLQERQLAANLLREERQRESSSVKRPLWNKPFSRIAICLVATFWGVLFGALLLHFR